MRGLAATDILRVWERGRAASPAERALHLLAASGTTAPEALPVGARDAALLELRTGMFGPRLEAGATCPACGERLDVELTTPLGKLSGESAERGPVVVETRGGPVAVRLPTAADLVEAAGAPHAAAARALLLERCVLDGTADEADEEAVVARLAEADPQALLDVALRCPACAHEWDVPLDVVAYLWAEIDAVARRLLEDVHTLASAYGWREQDVLALSPERRGVYLDLVRA